MGAKSDNVPSLCSSASPLIITIKTTNTIERAKKKKKNARNHCACVKINHEEICKNVMGW